MSDENTTTERPRSLVAELMRRRRRIARVQRTSATLSDAYSLVIRDLHAAYGESGSATRDETTA
jgi:hypothetical protein